MDPAHDSVEVDTRVWDRGSLALICIAVLTAGVAGLLWAWAFVFGQGGD